MTDTNGAKGEPRLHHEDEQETIVPAGGGTFGVDGDASGFGQDAGAGAAREDEGASDATGSAGAGLASGEQPDSDDPANAEIDASGAEAGGATTTARYDSNIDLSGMDRDLDANGNGTNAVPAEGGTFGVTHDASGYQTATGHPNASPYGDGFGAGPGAQGNGQFGAFSPPAETPAMAPPQYGTQVDARPRPTSTDYVAAALGIIALLLMLLPSFAYMVGGVLGVVAVVLGGMRLRGPGRTYALIAVITGCIAVAIAVATALLVYVF
ncbi:hypothetical protein [Gulosibacter molinativorax]|uniref:DUF4190 domain-containing protein n=1 Tax=Gulosibacter molinativorax TaxID=256821 RepID=A0ABT7C477_9MICO|nr:hypothetical protein [Gulosibacter molinativorax]MDJ1370023.1 hypothetical protein [Gulosibacter molinativorax]QUY63787.1 Hypotetical protein [Gulosibacter molinativorax]